MAHASHNERRKRRIRRNVTLFRRAAQSEAINRAKTTVAFFAVLNKLGGEIEVTKVDIDSAAAALTKLSYVIEPSAVEGNFMIRLVAPTEPEAATVETPDEVVPAEDTPAPAPVEV